MFLFYLKLTLKNSKCFFLQKVKYKITVRTGNSKEASTDSNVTLEIIGKNGTTSKMPLNNSTSLDKRVNLFERGQIDVFEIEAKNVGKVKKEQNKK